jgi:hypothetical protein
MGETGYAVALGTALTVAVLLSTCAILEGPKPNNTSEVDPRPFDVSCTEGSQWKNVHLKFRNDQGYYDIHGDHGFIARVPSGICSVRKPVP